VALILSINSYELIVTILVRKLPMKSFLNKAKDLFICGTEKIWLDALPNITNGHY